MSENSRSGNKEGDPDVSYLSYSYDDKVIEGRFTAEELADSEDD